MGERYSIGELDISALNKQILTLCIDAKTMIQLVAKLNKSYNYINVLVRVLIEKGYLRRIQITTGQILYKLNEVMIEP